MFRAWQVGVLCVSLLSSWAACAEEAGGILGRAWGTRWDDDAIRSLPGCEGQGETIADVEGYVAVVAQPECVGYRFSSHLTVNLMLIYPDIKWHSLENSRLVVDNLLAFRHLWGLAPDTIARLERWSAELDRRSRLRMRYGTREPVFPDMAYGTLDLPEAARGLQGYQLNFRREQYVAMKAALMKGFGAPTRQSHEGGQAAAGTPATGEVLEWLGEGTVAVMKEHGRTAASGYFVILTRDYSELLTAAPAHDVPTQRPTPMSYPWFLQLVEGFEWARDRESPGPGSVRVLVPY